MCLILLAVKAHPDYRLIVAANRDEFYERPSEPPAFWPEAPDVLAGRDLRGGGTWFGLTRKGRLAAVTNYRDPASQKEHAPSRGKLVSDYLLGRESAPNYLDRVRRAGAEYNGFNLLVGEREELYWYSNRGGRISAILPGVHGLSNHLLDTPWPKVSKGKERFSRILEGRREPLSEALFELLMDRSPAPDDALPHTGVALEWERILSSIFIWSPAYGTRSSTLLFLDRKNRITLLDRTFDGQAEYTASLFEYSLEG